MDKEYFQPISYLTDEAYELDKCRTCGKHLSYHYNYDNDILCDCLNEEQAQLGNIELCSQSMIDIFIKSICLSKTNVNWLETVRKISSGEISRDYFKNLPFPDVKKLNSESFEYKLIQDIKCGYVRFIIEVTDTLSLFFGNDLTIPLKPYIKRCLQENKCTHTVTKNIFVRQRGFRCNTCFPNDKTMALCESCIKKCHKDHDKFLPIVKVDGEIKSPKKLMFCDCHCYKRHC